MSWKSFRLLKWDDNGEVKVQGKKVDKVMGSMASPFFDGDTN